MTQSDPLLARQYKVSHHGEERIASYADAMTFVEELHKKYGGVPKVEEIPASDPVAAAVAKGVSELGGELVVDEAAKARIEALHGALQANGVTVDASQQFYATGTRMAVIGYETQAARKMEHDQKLPIEEAAGLLRSTVIAEKREDVHMTAREFARGVHVNGKLAMNDFVLPEQAVRGLLSRIKSPALTYVLGLRNRIAVERAKPADQRNDSLIRADGQKLASTLVHECNRFGDVVLKCRTRKTVGDIFAIMSPDYAPSDAPEVIDQILGELPEDAKGSWAYDPFSTHWELRADVWTPTPVEEQAVGEPFEGWVTFQSRDNGTSRFRGGGGISLLRCLNASVYSAEGAEGSRVHRGQIMLDIAKMLESSVVCIRVLCDAWKLNRETPVEAPSGVKIEDAIPGFWRSILTDRKSELAGVLPGKTERHVAQLSTAYFDQRREPERIVRSDFAQAWTYAIQSHPTPVRRNAELAVGDWLVSGRKFGCQLKEEEEINE